MDAEPIDFPTGSGPFSMARGRFICNMTDLATTPLLHLETGPAGRSDTCLPPRLERPEGLCRSSLEPHREGAVESEGARGRSDPHSPDMAVSAMIPQDTRPPDITPTEDSHSGGGDKGGATA